MSTEDNADRLAEMYEYLRGIDEEILELIGERNTTEAVIRMLREQIGVSKWDQRQVDDVIDLYVEELGNNIDGIKIATAIIGTEEQISELDG